MLQRITQQQGASVLIIVIFVVIGLVLLIGGYLAGIYFPFINNQTGALLKNANLETLSSNDNINVNQKPEATSKIELKINQPVDNFVIKDEKNLLVEGTGPSGAKIIVALRNIDQSTTEWVEQQMVENENQFSFTVRTAHLLPGNIRLHLEARDIEGKLLAEKDLMGRREQIEAAKEITWTDYVNINYGYKLKYPEDFSLQVVDSRDGSENPLGYRSIFWSKENFNDYFIPESEGLRAGIYFLAVEYQDKSFTDLTRAVATGDWKITKQEKISVNDLSADKYYLETNFSPLIKVYVQKGEVVYGITLAEADEEQKEASKKFLESFEFIK